MSWQPDRPADWKSLVEALDIILATVRAAAQETIALDDALGRTLATDVMSPIDHPPWDNSAMDGYAVLSTDVAGCTHERPARLRLIEKVPAGGFPVQKVSAGTTIRIMTGAPIPDGADSVIRVEHTESPSDDVVLVFKDADVKRNIRPMGEDVGKGRVAVTRGTVLRPADIGFLATVGAARVDVARKPRVAILSTGDELTDLDGFDDVLAGRKIVNSNSHALAAAVRMCGGEPVVLGIARDERASLREKLEAGLAADMLVTSAGASVGEHDLVKDVLEELGMETSYWRVRVRPGSPFSFGRIGDVAVVGLPGNPVSALVTFELFVKPAIRRALGRNALYSPTVRVRVAERIATKGALTHFLRVQLERGADGTWLARLTGPQGSGMISSIARADGLLVVPEAVHEIPEGAAADVIRLDAPDNTQSELGFTI
ncbi:MAG TPA: gephyrin-like molybdotransferase Glp [Longimicrobiales bacterium]